MIHDISCYPIETNVTRQTITVVLIESRSQLLYTEALWIVDKPMSEKYQKYLGSGYFVSHSLLVGWSIHVRKRQY